MTTYGTGFVSISTAIAGAPSVASGDIVKLWCAQYTFDRNFKFKTTLTLTGDSYTITKGKVARMIELKKCVIIDDDGLATTNTESLNNKITLLDYWGELDKTQVYVIIKSEIDSVNLALSQKGGVAKDYLKGYIKRIRGKPEGDAYFLDIPVVESTLS